MVINSWKFFNWKFLEFPPVFIFWHCWPAYSSLCPWYRATFVHENTSSLLPNRQFERADALSSVLFEILFSMLFLDLSAIVVVGEHHLDLQQLFSSFAWVFFVRVINLIRLITLPFLVFCDELRLKVAFEELGSFEPAGFFHSSPASWNVQSLGKIGGHEYMILLCNLKSKFLKTTGATISSKDFKKLNSNSFKINNPIRSEISILKPGRCYFNKDFKKLSCDTFLIVNSFKVKLVL